MIEMIYHSKIMQTSANRSNNIVCSTQKLKKLIIIPTSIHGREQSEKVRIRPYHLFLPSGIYELF